MQQHTVPTPYMVGDVHFYTTEINGAAVLFDTGPPTPQGIAALRQQVNLDRLDFVFVTHCHADHYGLVDFLANSSPARILLPGRDVLKFRHHRQRLETIQQLIRDQGFTEAQVPRFRQLLEDNMVTPALPSRYEVVEESDAPGRLGLTLLPCPGHSQSDLVYLYQDLAITGDVLLQNIFQVPLLDADLDTFAGRFRNYEAYCRTLRSLPRLRGLRILPGHRYTIDGVDQTVLFYIRKILERARRIRTLSAGQAVDMMEIVRRLFGDSFADLFVVYLKVSEIVFIQDFLAEPQRLRDSLEAIDLFPEVASAFATAVGADD